LTTVEYTLAKSLGCATDRTVIDTGFALRNRISRG
jgi:hypothetical protein